MFSDETKNLQYVHWIFPRICCIIKIVRKLVPWLFAFRGAIPYSQSGLLLTLLLNGISPSLAAANVRLGDIPFFLCIYFTTSVKSFTTSPAIISPATEGTKATEPGIARRSVHLYPASGGQIQFSRQLFSMSSFGVSGSSFE